MEAVIFAAGRGTRMGLLTKNTPKHLLEVGGEPILRHTISILPKSIRKVIVIIGYLGEKIETIGDCLGRVKIEYVEQKELLGTAHALWSVRTFIGTPRFMALGGDDWYSRQDLENCANEKLAFGVHKTLFPAVSYVKSRTNGYLDGFDTEINRKIGTPIYKSTGVYVLDHKVFEYEPVRLASGEFGLPHTIAKMARDRDIKLIEMPDWMQINTPEDLETVRTALL